MNSAKRLRLALKHLKYLELTGYRQADAVIFVP